MVGPPRDSLEMVVRRQLPRNIVVGRFPILGVVLRCEQVDGVVSVRPIEPHNVGSSRELTLLHLNWIPSTRDFDVLSHKPRNHLRHPRGITLILRNQKRIRRLRQPLLP